MCSNTHAPTWLSLNDTPYPHTQVVLKLVCVVVKVVKSLQSNNKANFYDLFQTFCGCPKRTILLDDIQDMVDEEDLQDHLEIHFQKPSNSGGEIESIKYIAKPKVLQAFLCESTEEKDDSLWTTMNCPLIHIWHVRRAPPVLKYISNHFQMSCSTWSDTL